MNKFAALFRASSEPRIERESDEIVAYIVEAKERGQSSVVIPDHYSLDTMRALNPYCRVTAQYRLTQVNRKNNTVTGYLLEW